ncbi:hotdog fold thioesterase [bacterium]|nr:MAG: hotdog fold thioesterase [bacterium]
MQEIHVAESEGRESTALKNLSNSEPFARLLGIRCLKVDPGYALCEMEVSGSMTNLFGTAHGGAIFGLMDEAFQLACNSRGCAAYALNISVTYVTASRPGDVLAAEAVEVATTARTGVYDLKVTLRNGTLIASAQAIAYRKKEPAPFLAVDADSTGQSA